MELLDLIAPSALRVTVGVNVLMAWSMYIILASGQLSLGNAAFMAIGAYVSSILTVKLGVPLIPAIAIGVIGGSLAGVLVGFPALRLRGIYLAMLTIGVEESIQLFLVNFEPVGGSMGMRGMLGTTEVVVLSCVGVVLVFLWRLETSRLGRAFAAVRDDEVAASVMGLNTTYIKVLSFAIGSAIASLAGAVFAHYMFYIEPANFDILRSLTPVFFVIFGGGQTFWGPAFGAIVLTLLPEYARSIASWRNSVYGIVILVMIIWRPQGLISKAFVDAIGDFVSSLPVIQRTRDHLTNTAGLLQRPGRQTQARTNAKWRDSLEEPGEEGR